MPITGLTLITVTGKYLKFDGTPASGTVTFTPTTVIVNKAANEIVVPVSFTVTLDGSGSFSIAIPATNDPDLEPTGFTYTVTETIAGASQRSYSISLPYDLAGQTLDLADVAPVSASTGTASTALTVQEEGVSLVSSAHTLNFTGAGVTASGAAGVKTINVPGGGSSSATYFNVKDYGAVGNGVTDDTAAIQEAIDEVKVVAAAGGTSYTGGVVFFPPGNYIVSGTLDCDAPYSTGAGRGMRLEGVGGGFQSFQASAITYTAASGPAVRARGNNGFSIVGLRIEYTSTSYADDLIDVDWYSSTRLTADYSGGSTMTVRDTNTLASSGQVYVQRLGATTYTVDYTGKTATTLTGCTVVSGSGTITAPAQVNQDASSDVLGLHIADCWLGGRGSAQNARTLIRPNHCLGVLIERCELIRAKIGILGIDPNYLIGVAIRECVFNYIVDYPIRNPNEQWTIQGCIFEPRADGSTGGVSNQSGTYPLGLVIENCWGGDITYPGQWIDLNGAKGVTISGNRFAQSGPVADTAFAYTFPRTDVELTGDQVSGFPTTGGTVVLATGTAEPPQSTVISYTSRSGNVLQGVTGGTGVFPIGSKARMGTHIRLTGCQGVSIIGNTLEHGGYGVEYPGANYGVSIAGNMLAGPSIPIGGANVAVREGRWGNYGIPNSIDGGFDVAGDMWSLAFKFYTGSPRTLRATIDASGVVLPANHRILTDIVQSASTGNIDMVGALRGNVAATGPVVVKSSGGNILSAVSSGGTERALISNAGDVEISTANQGVILKSANGTRYRLTVANDGAIETTAV